MVAILGAGYLAWVSLHSGPVAGCGPQSGCNKVLQSRWAYWLELPVSIPAVLVYLALMGTTFLLQKRPSPEDQRGSWAAIIALSVVVAGAALWFVGLQVLVIKAFCKFCMTAHACGFIASLICLYKVPVAEDPNTPMWSGGSDKPGVPGKAILPIILAGLAAVAGLVGGQLLFPKQRNVVKQFPSPASPLAKAGSSPSGSTNRQTLTSATIPPPPPAILSPRAHLTKPGLLSLYEGRFELRLDEVPMRGSPAATHVVVDLFDYTCPHCRELHPMLLEAQRRFSNQLGIVALAMPLSTNCNPLMPRRARSVANACDYARLSLAVWRAQREAFPQFDDWLFAPEKPVPVAEARAYAEQLVGVEKLSNALADDWITRHIHTNAYLHSTNWVAAGTPQLPQLVIGQVISSGPLNSVKDLLTLLDHFLDLR
jgi:uncharacterized membrane protein